MSGGPLQRQVQVTNPNGLHLRPIAAFVTQALRFRCDVTVTHDGRSVNGKSPLDLMTLAAEQGSVLTLEVEGPDAESALEPLAALLAAPAPPEENAPSPPCPPAGPLASPPSPQHPAAE
jgi:phosphotransferase system HPr (HPr) family protein